MELVSSGGGGGDAGGGEGGDLPSQKWHSSFCCAGGVKSCELRREARAREGEGEGDGGSVAQVLLLAPFVWARDAPPGCGRGARCEFLYLCG